MRAHSLAESFHCASPDADTLALSGALTFATAARALQEGARALARGGRSKLDLQGITHADSAGLACVLALLATASRNGARLAATNVPDGLMALARACDAANLLQD